MINLNSMFNAMSEITYISKYISISLIKRSNFKQIANRLNDYCNDQDSQFYNNQWYQLVLDYTEGKSIKGTSTDI